MFQLTNEQRECFGLVPIKEHWECIPVKGEPHDNFTVFLYLEKNKIVKCIICGDNLYSEYQLSEKVSTDRKYLLPKTQKGKPVLLTAATIQKRVPVGMCLCYANGHIDLFNEETQCSYFTNCYLNGRITDLDEFSGWVEKWCDETTDADLEDISSFANNIRKHVRYHEGDVFRFKIGRRLYGYGRILLDYNRMRKQKEAFWDILMGKPLVCSVYHIVTERLDVSVDELEKISSLPSTLVMDNSLYYGEYEIVGNLPIEEGEDFPIMYGNSISYGEHAVCYQCGKRFLKIENADALYQGFINNRIGFNLNFTLDILMQCIEEKSNNPYWLFHNKNKMDGDLRNPKYAEELEKIKEQLNDYII